jgi:hypothetical protein
VVAARHSGVARDHLEVVVVKVIKTGILPEGRSFCWIGARFVCDKCRGEFKLESGDGVTIISNERTPGGKMKIGTPVCPTIIRSESIEVNGGMDWHCREVNVLTIKNNRVPGSDSMEA